MDGFVSLQYQENPYLQGRNIYFYHILLSVKRIDSKRYPDRRLPGWRPDPHGKGADGPLRSEPHDRAPIARGHVVVLQVGNQSAGNKRTRINHRRIINDLVYEGMLKRKKGVGTFVHLDQEEDAIDFVKMGVPCPSKQRSVSIITG